MRLFNGVVLFFAIAFGLASASEVIVHKSPELAFNIPNQGDRLLSQYRGKVVALEFILTTCPHCQAASRDLTKYQLEMGKRGLQVIALAINALDDMRKPSEAEEMVINFVRSYQVGFPVGYV